MREAGIEICLRKPVKQAQLFDSLAKVAGIAPRLAQAAAAEAPAEQRRIRGIRNPLIPATRRQARILVAEDNAANRRVALLQLQKFGYSADGVANGLEALEALKQIPYDVVLMDCQMPEMDGFQATQEIRRLEQGLKHTTIVAMTASALEGERERCLAAGMDDYLSKPVRPEDMVAVIQDWIGTPDKRKKRADGRAKTPAGEVQVIDMTVISNLRTLQARAKGNLLAELIGTFCADSEKKIAAMKAAAESRDAEALCRAAHALKGGSGIVGANRMVSLCNIIEEMSRAGSTEGALPLIDTVEEEFGRARRELRRELEVEKASSADQQT
jgi:CheY-like chemotaxis protein/HPt (histidine-containing phosphotransfer) domain-containing protein